MPDAWSEDEVPPAKNLIVKVYIPDDANAEAAKQQIEVALGHMSLMYPMPKPVYTVVKETDWAEAWKQHYHPIRIGKKLLIRPLWVEFQTEPDDIEITLDPGMAFGTGTHPTTQLCLEALEDTVTPGITVLDLGSGSGILSIAAVKLGAAQVLGLDTDLVAVHSAQENIEQNNVAEKITIQQGSLETVLSSARRFDMVVVNILARVIIPMCEDGLGQTVRPGGLAIFSGLIEDQADDVEAALHQTGLEPYKRRQRGDWIAIEARRPH